jgi:hypothetical protein
MCLPERFEIVISEPVSVAERGGVADVVRLVAGFHGPGVVFFL